MFYVSQNSSLNLWSMVCCQHYTTKTLQPEGYQWISVVFISVTESQLNRE